jgi:hypothetical protein
VSQLSLEGGETSAERFGPRQQLILAALTEGPLTDDEAGALIHGARGKHAAEKRCLYCAQEGRGVLVSLRKRGLCIRRRSGQWERKGVRGSQRPPDGYDPSTAPFPEGF